MMMFDHDVMPPVECIDGYCQDTTSSITANQLVFIVFIALILVCTLIDYAHKRHVDPSYRIRKGSWRDKRNIW